jgi:hypothetical protein
MKKNLNKGVMLIELIIYMILLGALISTSFSVAFALGRDRSHISNLNERQIYGLAFFEATRNMAMNAESIVSPQLNTSSAKLSTPDKSMESFNQDWISSDGHIYSFTPQDIHFSNHSKNKIEVNGNFLMRGTTSRSFIFPVLIR